MNEDTSLPPLAVTLSREELLAVLNVLRAPTIPGLDREPSGELTPEQEAFALVVARRALLARELAQMRADGELLVRRGLLAAVGACAYAQDSILAYTWPAGAQAPLRLFGHIRGDDVVAHTRPAEVLHRFTMLPSKAALVAHVLAFCGFDAAAPTAAFDFTVSRQDFADARQYASAGNRVAAIELLVRNGAPEAAAASLVATWAAAPRVSVLQTLTQQGNQAVRTREFTLTHSGQHAWWAAPEPVAEAKAPIRVKTAGANNIRDLLTNSFRD
jgi:hypothetical protein